MQLIAAMMYRHLGTHCTNWADQIEACKSQDRVGKVQGRECVFWKSARLSILASLLACLLFVRCSSWDADGSWVIDARHVMMCLTHSDAMPRSGPRVKTRRHRFTSCCPELDKPPLPSLIPPSLPRLRAITSKNTLDPTQLKATQTQHYFYQPS